MLTRQSQSGLLPCPHGHALPTAFLDIPAGSKLLRTTQAQAVKGGFSGRTAGGDDAKSLTFGTYRSPEACVLAAKDAGHPINFENMLPEALCNALRVSMSTSPKELLASRLEELKRWTELARMLECREKELHQRMPRHAQGIMAPKRILLWQALLQKFGYPDMEVVSEVVDGVTLLGTVGSVAAFAQTFKPAQRSVQELRESARVSREALVWSSRSSGDSFLDAEVYRKTLDNWTQGGCQAPLT